MGRDKSTVGRELVRNGRRGRCGTRGAQGRATCRPRRRPDDPALAAMVRSCILGDHWSPERSEPHHPWQKPTVENTNGLIREFFPKGTDFSKVTDEEVRRVCKLINDRPRKVLGYRTANVVYREMLHSA